LLAFPLRPEFLVKPQWSLLAGCPDAATCPPVMARLLVVWNVFPAWLTYLGLAGLFFFRPTVTTWILFAVLLARYLSVTVGYHRYFSHHAFRTSRVVQFLLAFIGCTCGQRGPLWWTAIHRQHHHHTDTALDPHSPLTKGFWTSFFGWTMQTQWLYPDWRLVRDWTRYPELVWINKWWEIPWALCVLTCYLIDGWTGVFWGYCLSTATIFTSAFSVNSFGHMFGPQRFDTADQSRNNFLMGFLAGGDGWHNNHHRYPASARHGMAWYEVDATYRVILALQFVGLVWNVRQAPAEAMQAANPTSPLKEEAMSEL
jgi:stearoyl-CoA desaturase (Delta-9 desaturase)